jgi:hypothetical protein
MLGFMLCINGQLAAAAPLAPTTVVIAPKKFRRCGLSTLSDPDMVTSLEKLKLMMIHLSVLHFKNESNQRALIDKIFNIIKYLNNFIVNLVQNLIAVVFLRPNACMPERHLEY